MTVAFDRFEIAAGTPIGGRPTVTGSRPANGETNVRRDALHRRRRQPPDARRGVDAATLTTTDRQAVSHERRARSSTASSTPPAAATRSSSRRRRSSTPTPTTRSKSPPASRTPAGMRSCRYKISVHHRHARRRDRPDSSRSRRSPCPPQRANAYTGVKIGPDGKLYAGTQRRA